MTPVHKIESNALEHLRFVDEIIRPAAHSGAVVSAFEEIDRAEFIPDGVNVPVCEIYSDKIINLTEGSTISQPSLVAKMNDLMDLSGHERVLEIGTATGYQAALLSRTVKHVDTVELNTALARQAKDNFRRLRIGNVAVHAGNGVNAIPYRRNYDAIIVTAQLKAMVPSIIARLAMGGRLIAPVGDDYLNAHLMKYTRISKQEIEEENHGACYFVPFISNEVGGWTQKEWQESVDKYRKAYYDDIRAQLSKQWEAGGKTYDEVMAAFGGRISRILGGKKPVSEQQALEIILESLKVVEPPK